MKTIGAFLLILAAAAPAAAQPAPPFSVRIFGLGASQAFAANTTFDAAFGSHRGTFLGGGLQVMLRSGIFVDGEISRFRKTGQRADDFGGEIIDLGIPETVTITPIDVMAGYRLHLRRSRVSPYAEAGLTSYSYTESSPFSETTENLNVSKTGLIIAAGVEVRLLRQLAISGDVARTRVTGILGGGGVSQEAGENDLGGISGRIRIIIGR